MKSVKLRLITYAVVFVVTAVLTYIFAISDITKTKSVKTMNSAELPMVSMLTEKGLEYNFLQGYTCEMDQTGLRDVITPVSKNRELSFRVRQYGCVISGISYEIRNLKGDELIERTSVSDYEAKDGVIRLSVKFKNLLTEKQEYMMIIRIASENYGDISFYSRVVMMDNPEVDEKLAYAEWFSECTRSEEDINNIASRLDTQKGSDNTTLSYVHLKCKLTQVGYGDLHPVRASEFRPYLNEIDGKLASITLQYQVSSLVDQVESLYDIWEYFRINRVDDTLTYVNSYDRFMEQIYDGSKGVTTSGVISLGISNETELEALCSPNGYLSAFVRNGNLWVYSAAKNSLTKAFSFEDENSDNVRERNQEHNIRILTLSNEGEMDFAVYGYMSRGLHEGQCGISVMHYSQATGSVEERAFIESDQPLWVLEDDLSRLLYMNATGYLYFYRNHTIYYVNCDTKECMLVATDVNPQSCQKRKNVLMYQIGDNLYQSEKIYVLDCEVGNTQVIKASEGDYVRTLGFIDDNLVYGICEQNMESCNTDGVETYPMRAIMLVDSQLNEIKNYSRTDYYVTKVEFNDVKIILTRVKRSSETGLLEAAGTDEILSNQVQKGYKVTYEEVRDDIYQKRYNLLPPVANFLSDPVKEVKYTFPMDTQVYVSNTTEQEDTFYKVYGDGKLVLLTKNLAQATDTAYNTGGVVCNAEGEMIWCRYKSTKYSISIPEKQLVKAEIPVETEEPSESENPEEEIQPEDSKRPDAVEMNTASRTAIAALDTMLLMAGYESRIENVMQPGDTWAKGLERVCGEVYDLLGNSIELSLYFTNRDIPLVVRCGEGNYELVVEYTADNVTVMDLIQGNKRTLSLANMNQELARYGSVILTVPKAE